METSDQPPPEPGRGHRLSAFAASVSESRLGLVARRGIDAAVDALSEPGRALALLLGVAFVLRVLWLNLPQGSLIFDEVFYVNAARVILGWPVPAGAHYAGAIPGLDPNLGHPELGKLLIAGSMAIFGDNGVGWRLPDVAAGMIALYMVYRISRETDRSGWLAVLVVFLLAFDNLTFVHGRIGTLDMLVLAPMLTGSWLALRQRWLLAAVAIGIALLIKFTAIYAIGAIGLYVLLDRGPEWWRRKRIPWRDMAGPLAFVIFTVAFAVAGLGILDARFKPQFGSPFDHIRQMLSYGANLDTPVRVGFCPGVDSQPWQWLFNECQITYLRNDVTIRIAGKLVSTHPSIDFRGAMNPILVGAIPIATLFTLWYAWRTRSRLALWAIAWGAANYLPYVALAIFTPRIQYLYYMVSLIPAIAVAIALLITRAGLPRPIRWGFLAAYLVGFAAYFPFRQVP